MYLHAWKSGLKTTYYLRSRPATRINKTTTAGTTNGNGPGGGGVPATPLPTQANDAVDAPEVADEPAAKKEYSDEEAIACSLENPESCEACQ
jgi:ribonucleoside-diphosphate reductase alpha chain